MLPRSSWPGVFVLTTELDALGSSYQIADIDCVVCISGADNRLVNDNLSNQMDNT